MAKRKTVDIEKLKRMANDYCRTSGDQFSERRDAIHAFVSAVLMDLDQYKGFRYLTKGEVAPGFSWGITYDPGMPATTMHVYPDKTRVSLY